MFYPPPIKSSRYPYVLDLPPEFVTVLLGLLVVMFNLTAFPFWYSQVLLTGNATPLRTCRSRGTSRVLKNQVWFEPFFSSFDQADCGDGGRKFSKVVTKENHQTCIRSLHATNPFAPRQTAFSSRTPFFPSAFLRVLCRPNYVGPVVITRKPAVPPTDYDSLTLPVGSPSWRPQGPLAPNPRR